jgi:hypothetical protein
MLRNSKQYFVKKSDFDAYLSVTIPILQNAIGEHTINSLCNTPRRHRVGVEG